MSEQRKHSGECRGRTGAGATVNLSAETIWKRIRADLNTSRDFLNINGEREWRAGAESNRKCEREIKEIHS